MPVRDVWPRTYLWLIGGLSISALTVMARTGSPVNPEQLGLTAVLLPLGVLAQHFPVQVAPHHKINVAFAAYIASVLALPGAAAVWLVGAAQVVGQSTLALRHDPATGRPLRGARGVLFNTSQLVLASGVATLAYSSLPVPRAIAILAAAVSLYAANYAEVQVMLALQSGRVSLPNVLGELRRQAPEFAALALIGLVTSLAAQQTILAPLLIALPAVAMYQMQLRSAQATSREHTARESAEEARRSAERLRAKMAMLLDAVAEAIVETDADGQVVFANPAAVTLTGRKVETLVGRPLNEVLESASGEEGTITRPDQTRLPVEIVTANLGSGEVVVLRDISARIEAELNRDRAARAEKMHAIGQMASGLAHDLNQSLALISGYAQMAREALDLGPTGVSRIRECLDITVNAAHDGADMMRRLLSWVRTSEPKASSPINARLMLEEVAALTSPRWHDESESRGHPIRLLVDAEESATIMGDAGSLREALTNLVFNAVDALANGGVIWLRARATASECTIEVADDGPGIPPDLRQRIFEPFFTTKGERGTGLGLPQVMATVEQHNGRVELRSAPGQGTAFCLTFPAAAGTQPAAPTPVTEGATRPVMRGARVLAVDDELRLARLAAQILTGEGHQVAVATSGAQAVELLEQEPFDILITDLGMGAGMNGWQLADYVRTHFPATRVILATGWGATIPEEEAAARGVVAVIPKPYRVREVRELVARLANPG